MDILAFSVINLGRFNDLDQWLNGFKAICDAKQKELGMTFFISSSIPIANDGIRPIGTLFNNAYFHYLSHLITDFEYSLITTTDRLDRVRAFDQTLNRKKFQ
jgi:hypothetical protein